jgi:hypothetical protein
MRGRFDTGVPGVFVARDSSMSEARSIFFSVG